MPDDSDGIDWDDLDYRPEAEEDPPDSEEEAETPASPTFEALFGAPDYAAIIKRKRSATAREYETKVQSMLKGLAIGALKRGDLPDAAAILQHGPGFAQAAGDLTDVSPGAKKAIDMLTAPDSPAFVFGLAAFGFASQLYRNHQEQAAQVATEVKTTWKQRRQAKKDGTQQPAATTTVKLPFGRKITLKTRFRVPVLGTLLRGATATSVSPQRLVYSVFSDDKLRLELKKHGIELLPITNE